MVKVLRFSLFCAVLLGISCTTVDTPELPPPWYNSSSSTTGNSSSWYYYSSYDEWWLSSSSVLLSSSSAGSLTESSSSDVENSEVSSSSAGSLTESSSSSSEVENNEVSSSSSEGSLTESSSSIGSQTESSSSVPLPSSSSVELPRCPGVPSNPNRTCRGAPYNTEQYYCTEDGVFGLREYGKVSLRGITYKTVRIGNQEWLAENLKNEVGGSRCYENKQENCDIYGRLYDYNTARVLCDEMNADNRNGKIWKIPEDKDWKELENYVHQESRTLLSTIYDVGTDIYGFNALLGGGSDSPNSYRGLGCTGLGHWWNGGVVAEIDYHKALSFSVWHNPPHDYHASVRCVRNY